MHSHDLHEYMEKPRSTSFLDAATAAVGTIAKGLTHLSESVLGTELGVHSDDSDNEDGDFQIVDNEAAAASQVRRTVATVCYMDAASPTLPCSTCWPRPTGGVDDLPRGGPRLAKLQVLRVRRLDRPGYGEAARRRLGRRKAPLTAAVVAPAAAAPSTPCRRVRRGSLVRLHRPLLLHRMPHQRADLHSWPVYEQHLTHGTLTAAG